MAKEMLTVSGAVMVRTTRTLTSPCSAIAARLPLAGVAVKVEGKHRIGAWHDLGEATTNVDGRFSITSSERSKDWRFRIKVKLKSDDLLVRSHGPADWDTLLQQEDAEGEDLEGALLIYGDKAASTAGAAAELAEEKSRERAELWAIVRKLLDKLQDLGEPFGGGPVRPFRVEIVSPAITKSDWAGPARRDVHITPNATIKEIYHEVMHIWAYDNTRPVIGGQAGLIGGAISGKGTHESEEKPSTAFHEGFADVAASHLLAEVFGCGRPTPRNRIGLVREEVFSLTDVAHSDQGWRTVLAALTTPNLHTLRFGTSTDSGPAFAQPIDPPPPGRSPSMTFQQLLGCFAATDERGAKRRIDRGDMRSIERFLDRIIAIRGGEFVGKKDEYLRLFDPSDTVEPSELFPPA
jgi:hypothetical protein